MSLLVALLTAAQAADLGTRLASSREELNPLAAAMSPLAMFGAKAALVALLVAVYVVLGRGRLGTAVVALGCLVGAVGAASNV